MDKRFFELVDRLKEKVIERTGDEDIEVGMEPSSFTSEPSIDIHIHKKGAIIQTFCVSLVTGTWMRVFYT